VAAFLDPATNLRDTLLQDAPLDEAYLPDARPVDSEVG